MPSNSNLGYYEKWLSKQVRNKMRRTRSKTEEWDCGMELALYLRTPWIGQDRTDAAGTRLPRNLG